ncbi:SDR family oxidoreductase [Sphingobacterium sp. DK4209]|uniref:SDR family oxidoreductase n=1 Tax=Sphingobacterium zhuxiongii TaxID=2662364 RepID=A0A5Q0Q9F9_9SPHI|nr:MULTISPECIES: SDR family oxidoreductase [unclassified Sphingobacterium]MVZ64577.1 SDR family oxidoreductase [Sphingobacterium sp. DK4209]QGA25904.1 SDR family oxidoreductase [Sphingobacterium sp. dk4302]
MDFGNLSNKRAFITGSCEGIGFAIATLLVAMGCEVIIHDKSDEEKCRLAAHKIDPKGSLCREFVVGDLGRMEELNHIQSQLSNVDILVLNASTQSRIDFELLDKAIFDQEVNTNVWSSIALVQRVIPHMKDSKWGRIVTLGSVQEVKPHPKMAIYASMKAATSNLVKNLALQYASLGITVNNVAPGVVATARNIEALSNEEYAATMLQKIPIGSFAKPEDCAGIVAFLVSELGNYITGQTIYCDGGMSL